MARSYPLENKRFGSKPQQKKNRAARNTARRRAIASGLVKKGSKMENESPGRPSGKKDTVQRRPRVG